MSDEATIRSSLLVRKVVDDVLVLNYQSQPVAFVADVDGTKGPTPGAITVSKFGTDVDLSQLTTPGLCRIMNMSSSGYIEYGIYDPDSPAQFIPLGEMLPGETFVLRLSRFLGSQLGTGSGTAVTGSGARLRLKAVPNASTALVEAFEK